MLAREPLARHFSPTSRPARFPGPDVRLFLPGIMKTLKQVTAAAILGLGLLGCAGHAYLPSEAGGAKSDVSGLDVREAWIAAHPEVAPEITAGIQEGVFVPGMTIEQRDVITNPKRKGSTGNGFWRSRTTGDETRYQWFVSSQREPFVDGSGRTVCELVFVGNILTDVRHCSSAADGGDSG